MQEAEDIAKRALKTKADKLLLTPYTREVKITKGILGFIGLQKTRSIGPRRYRIQRDPPKNIERIHPYARSAIIYFQEALKTGMTLATKSNHSFQSRVIML